MLGLVGTQSVLKHTALFGFSGYSSPFIVRVCLLQCSENRVTDSHYKRNKPSPLTSNSIYLGPILTSSSQLFLG
jgi:hypothetical protein